MTEPILPDVYSIAPRLADLLARWLREWEGGPPSDLIEQSHAAVALYDRWLSRNPIREAKP